jgi:AhpC/TSA family/Disulphide bond corrector protein DsbC
MLEKLGVRIAAISYDSQKILRAFTQQYKIEFPLLSDADSAVIRRFGILNTNIAPELRAHGVPHPVQYLIAPDGTIIRKYFVANYQHRVAASEIALKEFGTTGENAPMVTLQRGALTVQIGLSTAKAFAGQEIGFFAKFTLAPSWHVYGAPLPANYTPTSVVFDDAKIARQSFDLPPATPMQFADLEETLPVYSGEFQGLGSLLLKYPLEDGQIVLSGHVRFQQCSDTACEPPTTLPFELPLTLEPFMVASR